MDTFAKVHVMRWMDTNTVKCLQVMRWIDKNRHQSPPPPHSPPPPPPLHVVTRALHILTTPTEQTSYPETWTKLQLMHQHMLLTKEYMNKRLITTVDQQNWVKMTANVVWWHMSTLKKYYHVPVFCNNKKAAASAPHGNAARRKWRIIAQM